MKRPWSILAGGILGTLVLAAVIFTINTQSPAGSNSKMVTDGPSGPAPQPTALTHFGPENGALADTLVSPDNISFHVVAVQRGTSKWLFHFHVHNNASHETQFLNPGTSHYFVLSGKGTPGVSYTFNQLTVVLTTPGQADVATHAALPASVAARGDVDGWLVADLSNFNYPPIQLMYVYGTVTSQACTNPNVQSTCSPVTGYRTLLWQL